jgi:hypothetical protein
MTFERRTHARTNLRVPLFLVPMGSAVPIRTETENVGTDGFFCYSGHLFSPGDRLRFLMFLPAAAREPQSPTGMCVHGEAQIIRVTLGPLDASYGIGCRLSRYGVLPKSELRTPDEALATLLEVDCL